MLKKWFTTLQIISLPPFGVSRASSSSIHAPSVLRKTRETSNKALNAINQMNLVPFLMSFLSSRDKLPISTITAAGMCRSILMPIHLSNLFAVAHCLYVLTDDNYPAISDIRSNTAYTYCLLDIVRLGSGISNGKGKDTSDERSVAFSVLASGAYPCVGQFSLSLR
jgi:hypothetical protein